ncbi:DMT family transporter [soil metagenome]
MADGAEEAARRLRGMAYMAFGIFAFSFQDMIIKGISGLYPVHEIVFVRSFLVLPLMLVIAHFEHGIRGLATKRLGTHIFRGSIMFLAYNFYYLGIAALPLATTTALAFSAPLFITALAGPLLGERVGLTRWLAVLAGFFGVLIVMWDRLNFTEFAVLLPVISSFFYALAQLQARHIGGTESGAALSFYLAVLFVFWSGVAGIVLGSGEYAASAHPSLAFLLRAWVWPSPEHLLLMAGCGLSAGFGIYGLSQGYRLALASEAALFEYTALPWSILWGFLFFAEIPSLNTLLGVPVVIAAGLAIAWRERRRAAAADGTVKAAV